MQKTFLGRIASDIKIKSDDTVYFSFAEKEGNHTNFFPMCIKGEKLIKTLLPMLHKGKRYLIIGTFYKNGDFEAVYVKQVHLADKLETAQAPEEEFITLTEEEMAEIEKQFNNEHGKGDLVEWQKGE
ncbi:hypothetical protein M2150_001653 [Lachnospiraceae bacterium PM6-15]|uniref:hypothetical protein n=1 Tax=Ohessyouella blattaphilus TaxID=2949333 RepID=UPI003E2A69E1